MRRKLTIGAALLGVLLIVAISVLAVDRRFNRSGTLDAEILKENTSRFRQLEIEALAGSTFASEALIGYYSTCHHQPGFTPLREQRCRSKFEDWIKVGLENGSPLAAQRQASAILQSNSCYDAYRADFWYRKFRKQFRSHPELLESVSQEIAQKKKVCVW